MSADEDGTKEIKPKCGQTSVNLRNESRAGIL